jgi:outer membrane protein, heavy metal efflux system
MFARAGILFLIAVLSFSGVCMAQEEKSSDRKASPTSRQAELKKAYIDYDHLHKARAVLEEHRSLLQSFADIAEARFRVGQGGQQDVLMAQVEMLKFVEREAEFERRLRAASRAINGLLSNPPGAPVREPADLKVVELPYSLEELFRSAQDRTQSSRRREEDAASGQPEERNDPGGERANRPSTFESLYSEIEEAYADATAAYRIVQLYHTSLIPLAGSSLESSFESYQAGRTSFEQLMEAVLTLLDSQLKHYENIANYQKALARLEPITGLDLTAVKETADAS